MENTSPLIDLTPESAKAKSKNGNSSADAGVLLGRIAARLL
jgi:hypothetical protein